MISLEELEKDIVIQDPLASFENLLENTNINNLTNFINIRKKQKEILLQTRNSNLAETSPEKSIKKTKLFKQIRPNEYSLYLSLDNICDLIFGFDEAKLYWENFLNFRNLIYDNYVKTKIPIVLHFTPYISCDWLFLDIGIVDAIFNTLKDNKVKIIGHISDGNCSLTSLYLLSAYCNEIVAYSKISSVFVNVNKSCGKKMIESINDFYLKKFEIIKNRGIFTDDDVTKVIENDNFIISIDNETLLKRMNIKE